MASRQTAVEKLVNKYQKAKSIDFVTMKITPEDAEYMLDSNDNNRHLNQHLVSRFLKIMENPRRWILNGECIKVAKTGRLLDGQHRLHALMKLGKPREMTVCFGLSESVFDTLDTGRSRTAGDILRMAGYKNWNFLAASMRYMLTYEWNENFNVQNYMMCPQEILQGVKRWPDFEKVINGAYRLKPVFSVSMASFFMNVTNSIDPDMSWDFFLKIETGEELKKNSGILQFRDLMLSYRAHSVMPDKRTLLALLILAWNSYYYDEPASKKKWDSSKAFPKVAGVDRKKLFGKA